MRTMQIMYLLSEQRIVVNDITYYIVDNIVLISNTQFYLFLYL